jgi:type IV pilus assembly protein PilE
VAATKVISSRRWENGVACCRRSPGFSLLELVIVLAVLAVLLTIAVPSYQRYVQRAHRAEAIRMMLAIAGCQERVRANTGFYDTSRCLEAFDSESHELRIEPLDSTESLEFTIIAEPQPGREDSCGNLSLDQAGTRGISGSPDDLRKCWSGR